LKTMINDTETGEMTEVSARDSVIIEIKGGVDAIFEPLANAPPAEQDMAAMDDLEKVLVLLSDVDAFYSYAHEAADDPITPSLAGFLEDTMSTAADFDPRAEDVTCTAGDPSCPALAFRLRAASLACDDYTVPPDSFDGQPDEPVPGLSSVADSIKTYERAADGQTTSVSCTTAGDGSSSIVTSVAPLCKDNDKGLCTAMCSGAYDDITSAEGVACLGLCTGELTDTVQIAAAEAANPDIADGIDSTEMDMYCPPIAALRVLEEYIAMTSQNIFQCYDFDCGTGSALSDCAVADETGVFSVPFTSRTCTMTELVATFEDAADDLRSSITDVEQAANAIKPQIATQLKTLMFDQMVTPFIALIDANTMDCSFLGENWRFFLDGACYNLAGAVAQYANIFTLCSQAGFLLVFLMFGLWRHFINMYDAAREEAKGEGEGKEEDPKPEASAADQI
jgi:hypothetical protein